MSGTIRSIKGIIGVAFLLVLMCNPVYYSSSATFRLELTASDSCHISTYRNGKSIDCFPNFEFDNQPTFYEIQIYNRWGEQKFHSNTVNQSWVCSDSCAAHVAPGTYFYVLTYRTSLETSQNDTVTVTIFIIH